MVEARLRTRVSAQELAAKRGKIVTDADYNLLLAGPAKIRKPDGSLLCVYMPGVLREPMSDALAELQRIRGTTTNRGLASGTPRQRRSAGTRTDAKAVTSSIIGSFDPVGPQQYCRLTAYSAQEADRFRSLFPLFQAIAAYFEHAVPERFRVQAEYAGRTKRDWVIDGTPFTTITVNSTYPTGVHVDDGDLEAGFSCLAVGRLGAFNGGRLVFPEYRVAVDMQHGDLLLMDAHEWHGNTALSCAACAAPLDAPGHECPLIDLEPPERISVVAYYRTHMAECGTLAEEDARRAAVRERRTQTALGIAEAQPEGE